VENVAERGPLATGGGALANIQKQNLREVMTNPDVGGNTKTLSGLNHGKILRKTQKQQFTENQKNTKIEK